MRIKSIEINNFRQYSEASLEFPEAQEFNMNYVLAENGIGKTTLLNAITWCLYNEELHLTEGLKDKTLPLITLKTLREMNGGEEKDTVVRITLEDIDGEVSFERTAVFRKTEEGEAYKKESKQKVIITKKGTEPDVSTTEEVFIREVNKRLPFKIQKFFFFDGEQLETYLADNNGSKIEETVLEMSQINLLITMHNNLDTLSRELRRTVSKGNSKKAFEASEKVEKKEKEIASIKATLENSIHEYTVANSKYESLDAELKDEPDIATLEIERGKVEDALSSLEEEKNQNIQAIKDFLKRYTMILTAMPRIKELYDKIKKKEENDELPPKYELEELRHMLEQGKCNVCGRPLDANGYSAIAELIKRFDLSQETGALLNKIYGPLEKFILDANNYEAERDKLFSTKQRIEDNIKERSDRLSEIISVVDKYTNKESILKKYDERDTYKSIRDEEYKKQIQLKVDLEKCTKELEDLNNELGKALASDKKHEKDRKFMSLASNAAAKTTEIINNIKDGTRDSISSEMSDNFFKLMWKDKFDKVEITENYSASIINKDGMECIGSCSAAEKELLALAFTLALHKESGFDGPLVIDTPLSRISGVLRENFAKVLKTVSASKQIILFVTEDEYSTNVKDVLETCANKKYVFELESEDYVKVREL
ncbi:MAG: AAA family ATPase [Bacillota bacterium]|nr:AAA family ATPase [Bacillota bacterium]